MQRLPGRLLLANRRRSTPGRPAATGFTLVEVVMVVLLMSIVGGISGRVVLQSMKVYSRQVPAMNASYQLRTGIDRMTRELRALKSADSITTMTATSVEFTDTSDDAIAFVAAGGELRRNGDLLAQGVTAFELTYRKVDGSIASLPADVRLVEIDLTIESGGQTVRARTAVFPRVTGHGS